MASIAKLSDAKREKLKKCSTERLHEYLVEADMAESEIRKMSREQLLESVAQLWLVPAGGGPQGNEEERWREEMQLRREVMEWEKQKFQAEQAAREAERYERQREREEERKERAQRDAEERERWEARVRAKEQEMILREQAQRKVEERYEAEERRRKNASRPTEGGGRCA